MEKIKVSIIMPVYNVEKYLERAIKSAIEQSYKNIEILIVNDGSKDNSEKIIIDYVNRDQRIKYIKQENKGLSDARNTALKVATGEYVFFFDSDDYIEKNTIKNMVEIATKDKSEMVICKYNVIYEGAKQKKIIKKIKEDTNENNFVKTKNIDFMRDMYINAKYQNHVWDKLYKLSCIKNNKIYFESRMIEDILFNIRVYPYMNSISFCDEYLYNYCIRENSITGKYCEDFYEQYIMLFELLEKDCTTEKKTIDIESFLGYNIYNLLTLCSKNAFGYGHYKKFYFDIIKALKNEKIIMYNEKYKKYIDSEIENRNKRIFMKIQNKLIQKKRKRSLWVLFFIKYKLGI